MLPPAEFKAIVRSAPLLAIDLIVRNTDGEILLGLRKNPPARDFWFVPGGRVFKNESSDHALRRILKEELGLEGETCELKFKGIYDHVYEDNVFEDPGFNTHYVVIASELTAPLRVPALPDIQHSSFRFVTIANLMADPQVHPFTKSYFSETPSNLWKFRYQWKA
jgi:colanic acid biosynthesis protein WcaH